MVVHLMRPQLVSLLANLVRANKDLRIVIQVHHQSAPMSSKPQVLCRS